MISMLIGVCVPLFNIGAVWPMARHNDSIIRECVYALPDAFFQGGEIAARQIRPTDPIVKNAVAHQGVNRGDARQDVHHLTG